MTGKRKRPANITYGGQRSRGSIRRHDNSFWKHKNLFSSHDNDTDDDHERTDVGVGNHVDNIGRSRVLGEHKLNEEVNQSEEMSWLPNDWHADPQPLQPTTRPMSQKEATMAVEPSDDQIQQIVDFMPGVDRETARRFLKVSV